MGTEELKICLEKGLIAALACTVCGVFLFALCQSYAAKHKIMVKRRKRRNPVLRMETDILVTHGRGMAIFFAANLFLLLAGGIYEVPAAENMRGDSLKDRTVAKEGSASTGAVWYGGKERLPVSRKGPPAARKSPSVSPQNLPVRADKPSGMYILLRNQKGRLVLLKNQAKYKPAGDIAFLAEGERAKGEKILCAVAGQGKQPEWKEMGGEFSIEQALWQKAGEVEVLFRSETDGRENWTRKYRLYD